MPEERILVINTTPLIALGVGLGSFEILRLLFGRVIVPYEVHQELLAAGEQAPGVAAFLAADWLELLAEPQVIPPYLANTLDLGEAAVIQAALGLGLGLVCIDEKVGRRVARLHNLKVTGSIGLIAKAGNAGFQLDVDEVLGRLREHGIWLGGDVEQFLRDSLQA